LDESPPERFAVQAGKQEGFAFSDTDGLKVFFIALFILHLMRPQPSVVHFNSMIKLMPADSAAKHK
jgi:hypothetical protein